MNKFFYVLILICRPIWATPTVEQAYFDLACALAAEGNHEQAIIHYKNVLQRNARHPGALLQLGQHLLKLNKIDEAHEYLQQCINSDPNNQRAHHYLANLFTHQNKHQNAQAHFKKAVELNPQSVELHLELADNLRKQNKLEEALSWYNKALALNSKNSDAHMSIASVCRQQASFAKALEHYDTLLTIYPKHLPALFEKANTLSMIGDTRQALDLYQQYLTLNPTSTAALHNIAFTLKKQGNFAEAAQAYQRVLTVTPDNKQAHLGLAQAYFGYGDYASSFNEFVWYNTQPAGPQILKSVDNLHGKTIFVGAELILDDMMQFVRYARLLKERGAKVIVQTPSIFSEILKQCPYIDQVVLRYAERIPVFNYYVPLLNLPALFKTTQETVPAQIPYLFADQKLVDFWKKRLATDPHSKIGIYLQHQETTPDVSEDKNVPFQLLAKLSSIQGLSFYNLQPTTTQHDLNQIPLHCIFHTFGAGIPHNEEGFANIAAIITQLDLVITRDAAIAHLAGALGKPVWLLLPVAAQWRWMKDVSDSPWYPSMKIFRQQIPGNWDSVIADVLKEYQQIYAFTPKQEQV